MVSLVKGEVSADTLESYRRASLSVHDLLHQADEIRAMAKLENKSAWSVEKHLQAEMLCAWNAFVLQNLGNEFLDADYRDDPRTVGFVPPITADQVLRFYIQIEGWLCRAHQAHSNPDYRLDVQVPAELPAWSEVEPCPNSHLHGMLHAMKSIRDHAMSSILFLGDSVPNDKAQASQYHLIKQLYAEAITKARYAEDLHGTDPSPDMHERVEPHIKECIEKFYKLGQWIAMPELAKETQLVAKTQPKLIKRNKRPMPGDPDFDPWCMTAEWCRDSWQRDPQARNAIKTMWELDPDPAATLDLHEEVQAAFRRGDIEYARKRDGSRLGHFFCCPWQPIYEVIRPIILGGVRLRAMEQFVFDVTAEGFNLGAPFTREIMVGNFQPTLRTEYGDPNEEPDH